MDPTLLKSLKVRELSPSSRGTLNSCPRKYELAKLSSGGREDTIHTVFGKAVAAGIQQWFNYPKGGEYISSEQVAYANLGRKETAILAVLLAWTIPLWEEERAKNKNLGFAVFMVEKFIAMCDEGELPFGDWTCLGVEIGFRIKLRDGFHYRGYLDLALLSPQGIPAVIELKTTGMKFTEAAAWQNQDQGNSYSLMLQQIAPGAKGYMMFYIVGLSYGLKWEPFHFHKGPQEQLDFVEDLLTTTQVIGFYDKLRRFPMNGGACYSFSKACPFFGICHLDNDKLITWENVKPEPIDVRKYEYEVDLSQLGAGNA